MKKNYFSPTLEMLPFCADCAITALSGGDVIEDSEGSQPWNDGELGGWT